MECWTEKDDYTAGHAGVGCPGPETTDAGFTWIDSPFGIHIGDYKDTKLDVAKTLQVEGKGYIKDPETGRLSLDTHYCRLQTWVAKLPMECCDIHLFRRCLPCPRRRPKRWRDTKCLCLLS